MTTSHRWLLITGNVAIVKNRRLNFDFILTWIVATILESTVLVNCISFPLLLLKIAINLVA